MTLFSFTYFDRSCYKHVLEIQKTYRETYVVRVDDEFYASSETRAAAFDEIADVIKANHWSAYCPI